MQKGKNKANKGACGENFGLSREWESLFIKEGKIVRSNHKMKGRGGILLT
jgi:hypothetical protein